MLQNGAVEVFSAAGWGGRGFSEHFLRYLLGFILGENIIWVTTSNIYRQMYSCIIKTPRYEHYTSLQRVSTLKGPSSGSVTDTS